MTFYTETAIETWLEPETRDLPMPNGSTRPLTVFRLVWDKADSLVLLNGYTLEELAGFAAEEAMLKRISFERAFTGVVAWLDNQRRARWGIG